VENSAGRLSQAATGGADLPFAFNFPMRYIMVIPIIERSFGHRCNKGMTGQAQSRLFRWDIDGNCQ
jgi:hypothetical protein